MSKHALMVGLINIVLLFSSGLPNDMVPAQQSAPVNISISHPANGAQVRQSGEEILFRCEVGIGKAYVPIVFLRDPMGQWWPWLNSSPQSEDRRNWKLSPVQFGVPQDVNQEFQIQIVAIPRNDIDNGIETKDGQNLFIEAGTPIKNSAMKQHIISRFPTISGIVSVTRK